MGLRQTAAEAATAEASEAATAEAVPSEAVPSEAVMSTPGTAATAATAEAAEAAETADALIHAGRVLFASLGYDGAAVRAITAAAGANLGAITYHFGSKRELYDRVVGSVVMPLAERVEAVTAAPGGVLDRLEAVVHEYFEYLNENPDLPQLMLQELAMSGVPPQAVAEPMRRILGTLARLVRQGQAERVVRAGRPELLSIFVLSVPVHLGLLRRALSAHVGIDPLDPSQRAEVSAAARAFVRAGLAVPPEEGA